MKNNTIKVESESDLRANHTVKIMANKIYHVFSSDDVAEDIKSALSGILLAASNEAGVAFDDTPEVARVAFPYLIKKPDQSYGRAIVHSIDNMLYASLSESAIEELKQYEVCFDTKQPHSYTSEDSQDLNTLADLLSKAMKHPQMPVRLYNVIAEEISGVYVDTKSPDNILANLKSLLEQEK